jgi:hypothetical protein
VITKWRNTTRGVYAVVIHTTEGKGGTPFVGQYHLNKVWRAGAWDRDGKFMDGSNVFDLVPEVDVDGFNIKVLSAINAEDRYYVARRWFIDHPEELK